MWWRLITTAGGRHRLPLALIGELLGFGSRAVARRKEISSTLDALTAYFLKQMPPRDSAWPFNVKGGIIFSVVSPFSSTRDDQQLRPRTPLARRVHAETR